MKNTVKAGANALRTFGLPLISIAVLFAFKDCWVTLNLSEITNLVLQYEAKIWIAAVIFAAASFYFVGKYDPMAAGHLGYRIDPKVAFKTGWRATACAQLLGFGLFSGALVRWRLLSSSSGVTLLKASKLTALVSVTFLAASTILTCAMILIVGTDVQAATPVACIGLILGAALLVFSIAPPRTVAPFIPNTRYMLRALSYAALDTFFACLIIYCFLPVGYTSFLTLYAVFLIALSLGTVSGLPGGAGPFELCMIALLAPDDPSPLVAALMAYRIVYFALPAGIAAPSLINPAFRFPVFNQKSTPKIAKNLSEQPDLVLSPPAEMDLTLQNQLKHFRFAHHGSVLAGTGNHSLVALGNPFGTDSSDTIDMFSTTARTQNRIPCFYKCNGRTAQKLRSKGWKVAQIGVDAKIDPESFDLSHRNCRQLRRKIRKAEKQVTAIEVNSLNYSEALQIDAEWQFRNGPARGFSVGRLTPELFHRQMVLWAKSGAQSIAFITISKSKDRWLLDLIRTKDNCPDGTIYMLVAEAIALARSEGIPCVDLGTAPFSGTDAPLLQLIYKKAARTKGLRQFKQCFAPRWSPVYIAAPSWNAMAFAAIDIWQLVHAPMYAEDTNGAADVKLRQIHNDYGDYEFASAKIS